MHLVEMPIGKRRLLRRVTPALGAALLTLAAFQPAMAEVVVRGVEGKPLHEARPAPAFIAPDAKIVVAQPSPSEVNPSFLGPVLLMKSAHIDLEKGTARLPLRRGQLKTGEKVWFVVTDVTDRDLAELHGIPYAAKMAYGLTGRAFREAVIEKDGAWTFNHGKVDFAPKWEITPGDAPNLFPPKKAKPGSVGDADYSPIVRVTNSGKGAVFNAPMLAFNVSEDKLNEFCDGKPDKSLVHDKVVSICPRTGVVELKLTLGYTFSKPILYLSTDANDELVSTLEEATYSEAMKDLPFANQDADPGEAAERIYVFVNGHTGIDNPHRQGLNSVLGGDGRGPLNVLGGIPTINLDYSPMWRVFPAVWTDEAVKKGYRAKLTDAIHIEEFGARGFIKSLDGSDLRAVGFIVNCPVVYRVN